MTGTAQSRIVNIDALRGIAIMGILLVNGPALNGPAIKDASEFAFQFTSFDSIYSAFIKFFAMCNFYPIFATLFGFSAALFMATKAHAQKVYLRRLFFLFIFGVLHAVFVWWGDILLIYSILGVFLLLLYQRPIKSIKYVTISLFSLGLLLSFVLFFVKQDSVLLAGDSLPIYQTGDFISISKQRISDYVGVFVPGLLYKINLAHVINFIVYYLQLLLCFSFGYFIYVGKYIDRINNREQSARHAFIVILAIAFAIGMLEAAVPRAEEALFFLSSLSRAALYSISVLYAWHFPLCRKLLEPFSFVGKMSLSNYLFHTTSLSLLFYGYGLGLYGRMGPFSQLPILLGLMLCSLIFSRLWLSRFSYGPCEWLWRFLTFKNFFYVIGLEQKRAHETK
jgi:uncharacterized protein